jgi:hypothetical protein
MPSPPAHVRPHRPVAGRIFLNAAKPMGRSVVCIQLRIIKISPKNPADLCGEVAILTQVEKACQAFFSNFFRKEGILLEMTIAFWLEDRSLAVAYKLNGTNTCGDLADMRERAGTEARNIFFANGKKQLKILAAV